MVREQVGTLVDVVVEPRARHHSGGILTPLVRQDHGPIYAWLRASCQWGGMCGDRWLYAGCAQGRQQPVGRPVCVCMLGDVCTPDVWFGTKA